MAADFFKQSGDATGAAARTWRWQRVTEVDGAVVVDDFGDEEADDDEVGEEIFLGSERKDLIF